MSCLRISSCVQLFQNIKHIKLELLNEHFINTYGVNIRNDILPKIASYMEFTHRGGLIPLYYTSGLPCRTWICVHCKMFIRND